MAVFKKQNNFYENSKCDSFRKLTELDFSVELDFDYIREIEEVNDFLLSKQYDLHKNSKVNLSNEVVILNQIFDICFKKFSSKIDVVELFDVITKFYDLSEQICFSRLTRNNKTILLKGISNRIGDTKFNKMFNDSLKISLEYSMDMENDNNESIVEVFGI